MIEVTIPSPGESITQVQLASWLVKDGDYIEKDDEIAEIDSDKATLSISAEESGNIQIEAQEGDTLDVGAVIAKIDTEAQAPKKKTKDQKTDTGTSPQESKKVNKDDSSQQKTEESNDNKAQNAEISADKKSEDQNIHVQLTPLVKEILAQKGISEKELKESIYQLKITRKDIEPALKKAPASTPLQQKNQSLWSGNRQTERKQMSTLRKKITERLVSVKNETAMLTTFNEVNMENIMTLRNKYKNDFLEKHGIKPGLMSFFTMASVQALQHFPDVNAQIDGEDIIYHQYADIGIAVSTPKGLMVPVLRDVENMGLAEIENNIKSKAAKAQKGKLTLDEMAGGTFTITNGGVFGSMLSTPIINPPQSAILGMHNIQERPVAINGKVEIKPIMYLALSYDHRIIDGKDSVSFLIKIKELIENPVNMLFQGGNAEKQLLGL